MSQNIMHLVAHLSGFLGVTLLGSWVAAQPASEPVPPVVPSTPLTPPPAAEAPPAAAEPLAPPSAAPADSPLAAPPAPVLSPADPRPAVAVPPPSVSDASQKKEGEVAPVVKASKEGFSLTSDDKDFQIKFRGYTHADARLYFDDVEQPPAHAFLLRRVRPIIEGTLYEYFGFRVMPDFGGGQTVLQDAQIDVRPSKEIGLRFGKYKAPFGLERLQSATSMLFIERAFPTQLGPNRDIGVQLYGELAGGVFNYAVGVFNGVPDGGSADTDPDKHKDLVARAFAHPLRATGVDALKDFGIGVAVSTGKTEGTLAATSVPQIRSAGQQTIFRYRATEGDLAQTVVADGRRNRISPQLYYYLGPFGLLGEYVLSSNRVSRGDSARVLENHAWQVSGTFVIGGAASFDGVKPDASVGEGGHGAFELTARYQGLHIDEDAFPTYADDARSVRSADGFGIGVGWWANRAARFMANFDSTSFDGGAADDGDRASEKVVLFRSQISW